jgi:hypothetical protein
VGIFLLTNQKVALLWLLPGHITVTTPILLHLLRLKAQIYEGLTSLNEKY